MSDKNEMFANVKHNYETNGFGTGPETHTAQIGGVTVKNAITGHSSISHITSVKVEGYKQVRIGREDTFGVGIGNDAIKQEGCITEDLAAKIRYAVGDVFKDDKFTQTEAKNVSAVVKNVLHEARAGGCMKK